MRRALAVVSVLAALGACSQPERPGGIVERWLLSLNQGAAGRPEAYAPDDVSQQVVPDWRELDPGELDVIEVGRAASGEAGTDRVAFRIVTVDGAELKGVATVDGGRVTGIDASGGSDATPLPSEGGPGLEPVHAAGWLVALGVAGVLIACSWALMTVVRRRSAPVA